MKKASNEKENNQEKINSLEFEKSLLSTAYFQLQNTFNKLQESEEKFLRIFQTSPYAIVITREEDGKIIDANEAFFILTGYTREESIGNSTIILNLWINIEDRKGVLKILKDGGEVRNKEFQFRKKNGEIIFALFFAQTIHIGGKSFILSSVSDITESKKEKEELKKLNNFMIDRELKMIALKKEVEELKTKLENK